MEVDVVVVDNVEIGNVVVEDVVRVVKVVRGDPKLYFFLD